MISTGLEQLKRAVEERSKGGMQTGKPMVTIPEQYALRAIAELEWAKKRLDIVEGFIYQYRYRIKGGEPMQEYIDEMMEE